MSNFLSSKELSKKLQDFRESWYGIAQHCEAISDSKSGLEESFKATVDGIYDSIRKCIAILREVEPSMKHLMPSKKVEIEYLVTGVVAALDDFGKSVEQQLEEVKNYRRVNRELSELTVRRESMEKDFRDLEAETSKVCMKYFERRNDYSQSKEKITSATRGKLEGIKGRFIQKFEPIVEGYDVVFLGRPVDYETIFARLMEKPQDVEAISLRPKESSKGLLRVLGGKNETKEAKEAVLRYVSQELVADAKPILAMEAQEIARLDAQFADLRALELNCKEAEKKLETLAKPRTEASNEITGLMKASSFSLAKYDAILELRERYLKIFNDANEKVKILLKDSEELLDGHADVERDVEKRELKGQIKELKKIIAEMERERRRLEGILNQEREKSKNNEEMIAKYREKLKGMQAHIRSLEDEMNSILRG